MRDLTTLLDDLDEAGAVFRSATEPFDTSTAVSRMLMQMLGVLERKAAKHIRIADDEARPIGETERRYLLRHRALAPRPSQHALSAAC